MQPTRLPPDQARGDAAEDAQWSRPECQAWTGTLLLGTCLLYCARVSMPICTVSMSQDFGWNKKEAGIVLSSFFWGYCLTQVAGGHLGDRIGGEKVILLSASAWGLITAATPLLAHLGSAHLVFMTFSRILTGLLQGVYFPALTSLLSQKVPESERAFTYSAVGAGSQDAGDGGGGLPAPGLVRLAERLLPLRRPHPAVGVLRVQTLSWPWTFWCKACRCPGTPGSPGDSSSGSLPSGRPSSPSCPPPAPSSSCCPGCPPSSGRPSPAPRAGSSTWCPGWWQSQPVCSAGFSLTTSSVRVSPGDRTRQGPRRGLASPWEAGGVLPGAGYRTIVVRKFMQVMGLGLSSVFALCLGHTSSFCKSVFFASASIGLQTFNHSGISVNIQDLAPSCAGVLFGVANTAGALAGVVGVGLGGYLIETTGSWTSLFHLVAAISSLGLCSFLVFGKAQRVDLGPTHQDL
ncbi:solute carrier family 17 member 9 isoform X2 [Artibeus jamaicensis]|uniref:solute carrier family 17 member 9 isoform X2 n=1 Tax=Artibeus jamaicensis TaxID=9417 RepID=UPI00235A848A|nr:solute carrier family 17 member 9 isoform X2 [Artibeus jamaicensis]